MSTTDDGLSVVLDDGEVFDSSPCAFFSAHAFAYRDSMEWSVGAYVFSDGQRQIDTSDTSDASVAKGSFAASLRRLGEANAWLASRDGIAWLDAVDAKARAAGFPSDAGAEPKLGES